MVVGTKKITGQPIISDTGRFLPVIQYTILFQPNFWGLFKNGRTAITLNKNTLAGFEPTTNWLRVQRSNHYAWKSRKKCGVLFYLMLSGVRDKTAGVFIFTCVDSFSVKI